MRLNGMDVDTAVNTIVGSLLKQGYLDELANSILVTVEDNNILRGEKLQAELTEEIDEIMNAASINASILAQHVEMESSTKVADAYDISHGKAVLIERILKANPTYKEEELAKLSVNELNLILSNPENEVTDVVLTGDANESGYIGKVEAMNIAFEDANIGTSEVQNVEVDFDYEYGKMVYEVDFWSGKLEYEYTIDAKTGDVLYSQRK